VKESFDKIKSDHSALEVKEKELLKSRVDERDKHS
jgi:hypothetical protein